MNDIFARTQMLIGPEGLRRLHSSRVAVFGLGGVGSYAVEALARAGIGHFVLVDNDLVAPSNINRQLIALHSTLGSSRWSRRARILDINPAAEGGNTTPLFCRKMPLTSFGKTTLSGRCHRHGCAKVELVIPKSNVPVISCMGAGSRWMTGFVVVYLSNKILSLSKVMRRELKAASIGLGRLFTGKTDA